MRTPCEYRGWKVGDLFEIIDGEGLYKKGELVKLLHDDNTSSPMFVSVCHPFKGDGKWFISIDSVTPAVVSLENE